MYQSLARLNARYKFLANGRLSWVSTSWESSSTSKASIYTYPNLCSLNVAMFSKYLVETHNQVIVLGWSRVLTFSRDSGKLKKWGPSKNINTRWMCHLSSLKFKIYLPLPEWLIQVLMVCFVILIELQTGKALPIGKQDQRKPVFYDSIKSKGAISTDDSFVSIRCTYVRKLESSYVQ